MKRFFLFVAALGIMTAISAVAFQQPQQIFPYLDWPKEAPAGKPTTAILLEFGLNDANVRDWSGTATVSGAKVVHREGYRFRSEDKLVGQTAWEASSHRGMRVPKGQPAVSKLEPIATIGVVLHLQDAQPDARVAIALKDGEKAEVALGDVRAGKKLDLWNGAATVRLITTATPVADGPTEDDFPAAAWAPDGSLWVVYVAYHLLEDERRIEAPQLKEQPADFKKYHTPGGRDQVMMRRFRNGKWDKPIEVTKADMDINRVAIGMAGEGGFWLTYSAQKTPGIHQIFGRACNARGQFGDEVAITTGPRDLNPVMCTDANGQPLLGFQSWNASGVASVHMRRFQAQFGGGWTAGPIVNTTGDASNAWYPAVAGGPLGRYALAYDFHSRNINVLGANYDVYLLDGTHGAFNLAPAFHRIASTSKFEARPSVVYDTSGRLWVAYEEGPEKWGKDYGALDSKDGNPLYNERHIRVVCHQNEIPRAQKVGLSRPVAELPTSKYDAPRLPFEAVKTNQYERATRYAYPTIGLDGAGNIWVAYRQNFGSRYSSHPGAYWLTFVRRLEGDKWSEPIEVHHSDGLLDSRPVLLPHPSGGLLIVHNTDGRYTTPETIDNQIYASVVNLPGKPPPPKLVPHNSGTNPSTPEATAEHHAVNRIQGLSCMAGGKKYQHRRGEYHRHTEISWDGAPDGSLEDMFRYAIDAVRFDWIGNGDHDNGAGREYSWWLTQKLTDAYAVPNKFTTMFTYERSVGYPHGHRNVMFAQRGIRTLPRLAPPPGEKGVAGVHADDTKMLYRYLKEFNGICAMHTSATGMGTDWRDNDPVHEPIVEIYQGDRMSYEYQGAPRAGYDPKGGMEPANVGGWQPLGFINLALKEKGYKLGFQASSDHWSTHISFFTVLVEAGPRTTVQEDRQALLDAIKKRHCYGATDNIWVYFRWGKDGPYIMGDEVPDAVNQVTLGIDVVGTGPIAKVDVLRDSEVVETFAGDKIPGATNHSLQRLWTEPKPLPGKHYYYIRVLQEDNEIAWASPIWVDVKK